MKKSKDADALQDDLTAKSVSSKSAGGSFGTFDRTLARAMALCTRHYRVDWSLGIYDEATRRVNIWQGLKVLRKFFMSEPKSLLRQFRSAGLLVFGEHEVLYDPGKVGARAARLMPRLRVEVVPGAGHAAVYDKPEVVNGLLLSFFMNRR
ncbi:MAG: alpha/beta hydrolase [Chromatiales bacterium]|nr:MAG: alpha/beta hydrolase [Chromatiales bacterium]